MLDNGFLTRFLLWWGEHMYFISKPAAVLATVCFAALRFCYALPKNIPPSSF